MATEKFSNFAQTTLNTMIDNSTTSVIINDATNFPTNPQFRINIENEIMLVTGISGTTFTVTRGAEGTTATSHDSGAIIIQAITSGGLSQSLTDTILGAIGNINVRGQGMFVAVHFEQNQQSAFIFSSNDGISWNLIQPNTVYPTSSVRDPSLYYDGTTYWMAYTRIDTPFSSWGLASSPDLINWTHVTDIDESGLGSIAWAPEFFVDSDGSLHIFLAIGNFTNAMQIHETHPTNSEMTTWSTAVKITGTSLPSDMIDAFVTKVGATYYLWYKNDSNKYIEVATSSSLTSGYIVSGSGHWMSNWASATGNGWEGPCLVQIDATTWYMYVDNTDVSDNGLGYEYSIFTGTAGNDWLTGSNWSALSPTNDPLIKRHGTILRIRDFLTARNCFAALTNGTRNPGAMVTGATAVSNSTTTALTYSVTVWDNASYFDGSTKMTVTTSGFYHINSYTHWSSNTSGERIIEIRKNGSTYLNGVNLNASAGGPGDTRQIVSALLYLIANDYIEIAAFQTSGGTLTPIYQNFSIIRIS